MADFHAVTYLFFLTFLEPFEGFILSDRSLYLIANVPTLSQDGYLSRHAKKEYSQSDGEKAIGYSTVSHG